MLSSASHLSYAQEARLKAERSGTEPSTSGSDAGSPFAAVASIMRWETFHMVQVLWMGVIDLPVTAAEKDWGLQVSCLCAFLPL